MLDPYWQYEIPLWTIIIIFLVMLLIEDMETELEDRQ